MLNKKMTALICGAAGVCMLTTAAVASYRTMNGYDALKKSILSTRDYTNCTLSVAMALSVDGEEKLTAEFLEEAALDNKRSHGYSKAAFEGQEFNLSDSYYIDDAEYIRNRDEDNTFYTYPYSYIWPNLWGIEDEDRETADKAIRFAELLCDTFVGDLKNNFICTEDSDESVSYSITLDSVQIPELVNAGLSMVFSMSNNTINPDDPDLRENSTYFYTTLLGDDPILDNVELNFTVNKDGTFRNGSMTTAFTGNGHTISFDVTGDISKVGETNVISPQEQGFKIINGSSYYEDTEAAIEAED